MLSSIESAFESESRANERLKQFVADASHELRTPLAAISGYTELHRKGALSGVGGTDHAMGRIESESRRMRNLVEDLLLLARLDLAQSLDKRPVEITALIRDAVADSMAIDPDRLMTIDAPERVEVDGDPEGLIQIISNLLANVRAHTPPGTPATVTVRAEGRWVEVAVTDQGPGFPSDSLASVFNRFYRADESRSRKSGGSGLGLAIVEALARAHGGSVSADNASAAGARITVRLPQAVGIVRQLSDHPAGFLRPIPQSDG
jgi:two-component system OmpR family sensor kinase